MFNLSCTSGGRVEDSPVTPCAHFQCHTRRVKKLAVSFSILFISLELQKLNKHGFNINI